MASKLDVTEFDFLDDRPGLRWIRWIDNPSPTSGKTSAPRILVRLETLNPEITRQDLPALDIERTLHGKNARLQCNYGPEADDVEVDAGMLPALRIGAVFDRGRECGMLRLRTKTFNFKRIRTSDRVLEADDPRILPQPESIDEPMRWLACSREFYPRGGRFKNANMLVLHDEKTERTLQIPPSEVFRSLIAPHSSLARAMLGGPWHLQKRKVVNEDEDRTFCDDRGVRIGLRMDVPNSVARALYFLLFDDVGQRVARSIFPSLVGDRQRVLRAHDPFGLVPFRTGLPFTWTGTLKVKVRGFFPLPETLPKLFLGLQIIGVDWPDHDLDEIEVHRDNAGDEGKRTTETGEKPPHAGPKQQPPDEIDGGIKTDPDDDPATDAKKVVFQVPGSVWISPPKVTPIERDESKKYLGEDPGGEKDPKTAVNFGDPAGRRGQAPADIEEESVARSAHRYDAVAKMLDELERIESFRVHEPPTERLRMVGSWPAWEFPRFLPFKRTQHRWSIIDPDVLPRMTAPLRTALVLRVQDKYGPVTVIVTEPRIHPVTKRLRDTFCSLTSSVNGPTGSIVSAILECGAEKQGVWGKISTDEWANMDVQAAAKWSHQQVETTSTDGSIVKILGSNTFETSLKSVLGA